MSRVTIILLVSASLLPQQSLERLPCYHQASSTGRDTSFQADLDFAADLLWTLTSLRMWEDLVVERGWSAERYQAHVYRLLLLALTNIVPDSSWRYE